jgi:hypothetical protein
VLGEPAEGDRVVLRRSCWGSGESVMRRVRVKGEGGDTMWVRCGAVRGAAKSDRRRGLARVYQGSRAEQRLQSRVEQSRAV